MGRGLCVFATFSLRILHPTNDVNAPSNHFIYYLHHSSTFCSRWRAEWDGRGLHPLPSKTGGRSLQNERLFRHTIIQVIQQSSFYLFVHNLCNGSRINWDVFTEPIRSLELLGTLCCSPEGPYKKVSVWWDVYGLGSSGLGTLVEIRLLRKTPTLDLFLVTYFGHFENRCFRQHHWNTFVANRNAADANISGRFGHNKRNPE